MINFIIKRFIKKPDLTPAQQHTRYGLVGGVMGMILNLVLFLIKAAAGLAFGSIAVVADAANNLSDAASSLITFVSFRLSTKAADKDHPYGHGRIEYISGLIVSFIIVTIGLSLVKSSVTAFISPTPVTFSLLTVAVLLISILIKLWLFVFFKKLGRQSGSTSLNATAYDSLSDLAASTAVLVSVIVLKLYGLKIDGLCGLIVSVFIVINGIKLIKETIDPLLGSPPSRQLTDSIIKKASAYPGVIGIHDLIIHNYGPGRLFATMHVEVDANANILISHDMVDNIERDFMSDMGLQMVIHMDPVVTNDKHLLKLREKVKNLVTQVDSSLTIHDFRMVEGATHTNLLFDITVPPGFKMKPYELKSTMDRLVKTLDPNYYAVITIDDNFIQN